MLKLFVGEFAGELLVQLGPFARRSVLPTEPLDTRAQVHRNRRPSCLGIGAQLRSKIRLQRSPKRTHLCSPKWTHQGIRSSLDIGPGQRAR